jgi:hypothetical protein
MKAIVSCQFFCEKTELDTIGAFENVMEGWDFIMFTDRPDKISVFGTPWTIKYAKPFAPFCGTLSAKHLKWCVHEYLPEVKTVLWIDAFYHVHDVQYFNSLCENFYALKHLDRNDIRDELEAVKICKKSPFSDVHKAKEYIDSLKLSCEPTGLFWTGCVFRKITPEIINLSKNMFELCKISFRDQIWAPLVFKNYLNNFLENKLIQSGDTQNTHKYSDPLYGFKGMVTVILTNHLRPQALIDHVLPNVLSNPSVAKIFILHGIKDSSEKFGINIDQDMFIKEEYNRVIHVGHFRENEIMKTKRRFDFVQKFAHLIDTDYVWFQDDDVTVSAQTFLNCLQTIQHNKKHFFVASHGRKLASDGTYSVQDETGEVDIVLTKALIARKNDVINAFDRIQKIFSNTVFDFLTTLDDDISLCLAASKGMLGCHYAVQNSEVTEVVPHDSAVATSGRKNHMAYRTAVSLVCSIVFKDLA